MTLLGGLRKAHAKLEPERVIAVLDQALSAWRAPDSIWRARLARDHGLYSKEVLEQGTLEGLRGWNGEILSKLRALEISESCWTPPVTAVWLAGSIPTSAFSAMLLPLLAGSAIYVKPSSEDELSAQLFYECLDAIDRDLARAVEIGEDPRVLEEADAVVAHGRDKTIAAIRERVPPSHIFVGYGHKLSLAAIGRDVDVEEAAAATALDTAFYDGRGCLSPAHVWVEDHPRGRAVAFAKALARELERLATKLPRGRVAVAEAAALHELRARAAMREGVRLDIPADSTAWGVMLEAEGARPGPGFLRNVPLIPFTELEELAAWCAGQFPHLSSIGQAGWGSRMKDLVSAVQRAGGSRICALGRMQFPSLDWNHDGQGPLRPLLRLLDVDPVTRS